jgi:hypothetical protein
MKAFLNKTLFVKYIYSIPSIRALTCEVFSRELGNLSTSTNPKRILKFGGYDSPGARFRTNDSTKDHFEERNMACVKVSPFHGVACSLQKSFSQGILLEQTEKYGEKGSFLCNGDGTLWDYFASLGDRRMFMKNKAARTGGIRENNVLLEEGPGPSWVY